MHNVNVYLDDSVIESVIDEIEVEVMKSDSELIDILAEFGL